MKGIVSDVNIQGHVRELLVVLESPEWREFWVPLALPLCDFDDLRLPEDAPDVDFWQACQDRQLILLTANRNQRGPDSLETTIRTRNTIASLPIFTLADADRVVLSRAYAERVAVRLLDYLLTIDNVRGAGRLYLP